MLVLSGAHFLVDGASSIAKRLRASEIVIGLTIVAFGTSAPELVVNSLSSLAGRNELVLGNLIGSNLINILLNLGIAGLVYPLVFPVKSVRREIPFSLLVTLIVFLLANDRFFFNATVNRLSRFDGLILLVLFGIFLYYAFRLSKTRADGPEGVRVYSLPKTWIYIVLGVAFLFLGGKLVVDYAVLIARELQVSEKLIGLTVVSLGTTLPELTTSIVGAYKKRSDLVVGNVVGSNIFNLLLILGVSTEISPISYNPVLNLDLLTLALGTVFLLIAMLTFKRQKLDRWEALVLAVTYIVYLVLIILRK